MAIGDMFRPGNLRHRTKSLTVACLLSAASLCLLLFFFAPIRPRFAPRPPFTSRPGPHQVPFYNPLAGYDPKSLLREKNDAAFPDDANPQACPGPRGAPVLAGRDLPRSVSSIYNVTFPAPTMGSYEALGLDQSWLTADSRYGPYGYRESEPDYAFPHVDWERVNWARLQHDCVVQTLGGKIGSVTNEFDRTPRFVHSADGEGPPPPTRQTGRQVIVLRTWDAYEYHPEDMWNIRSIITEVNLATGGRYEVVLMVDVKDKIRGPRIHHDETVYAEVLRDSVPPELRDMTILYHKSLLTDWYAKVGESAPNWQIMQPLQLFAHFYPEFDQYWQIELDTRFTGHAGDMLRAFHRFGKKRPYKHARELASWVYMSRVHGTWEWFTSRINKTLGGGATVWGPVRIKTFEPIMSAPAMAPQDDDFEVGVGTDADLLLTTSLNDIRRIDSELDWVYKGWYKGFEKDVPRFISAPAQCRASWTLLETAHQMQRRLGVRLASEATLPSFALWNGLKVVGLPIPIFQSPVRDIDELNFVHNGGKPGDFKDGLANGPAHYRSAAVRFFIQSVTWAWDSKLPQPTFNKWLRRLPPEEGPWYPPANMPAFMAAVGEQVYMPPLMMHPRKTNAFIS